MIKPKSRRRLWIAAIALLVLTIVTEIVLRAAWGFGNMVLFFDDPAFEYLASPSQDVTRFGNHVIYNEYSMRSAPLSESDSCIVLGFGDSVINGGTLTDHDNLATTIVEKQLGPGARFLNISAGSWGPDNCAGYLKKYGDFGARMIILFISSHDAHDNMTFEKTVGVHEAYPDHQYPLAIIEVIDKYLIPRIAGKFAQAKSENPLMINKDGEGFNTGFQYFVDYAHKKQIPFVVCLHAEKIEVENKAFNPQGQEVLDFCSRNNIKVITGFDVGEKPEDYRDEIHLSEDGQKVWVDALAKEIKNNLASCFN